MMIALLALISAVPKLAYPCEAILEAAEGKIQIATVGFTAFEEGDLVLVEDVTWPYEFAMGGAAEDVVMSSTFLSTTANLKGRRLLLLYDRALEDFFVSVITENLDLSGEAEIQALRIHAFGSEVFQAPKDKNVDLVLSQAILRNRRERLYLYFIWVQKKSRKVVREGAIQIDLSELSKPIDSSKP